MKSNYSLSFLTRLLVSMSAFAFIGLAHAKGAKAPEQIPESTLITANGTYILEKGSCDEMPEIHVVAKNNSIIATGFQKYWGEQQTQFKFPKINRGKYRVDYDRDFIGRKIQAEMEVRGYITPTGFILNKWLFGSQSTNAGTVDTMDAVSRLEKRGNKLLLWRDGVDNAGTNYQMDYVVKKLGDADCVYRQL